MAPTNTTVSDAIDLTTAVLNMLKAIKRDGPYDATTCDNGIEAYIKHAEIFTGAMVLQAAVLASIMQGTVEHLELAVHRQQSDKKDNSYPCAVNILREWLSNARLSNRNILSAKELLDKIPKSISSLRNAHEVVEADHLAASFRNAADSAYHAGHGETKAGYCPLAFLSEVNTNVLSRHNLKLTGDGPTASKFIQECKPYAVDSHTNGIIEPRMEQPGIRRNPSLPLEKVSTHFHGTDYDDWIRGGASRDSSPANEWGLRTGDDTILGNRESAAASDDASVNHYPHAHVHNDKDSNRNSLQREFITRDIEWGQSSQPQMPKSHEGRPAPAHHPSPLACRQTRRDNSVACDTKSKRTTSATYNGRDCNYGTFWGAREPSNDNDIGTRFSGNSGDDWGNNWDNSETGNSDRPVHSSDSLERSDTSLRSSLGNFGGLTRATPARRGGSHSPQNNNGWDVF